MNTELHNTLPNTALEDAREFVVHATKALQDAGLVFNNDIAIKTAHAVHGISMEDVVDLQQEAATIESAYTSLPQLIQCSDIAQLLDIEGREGDLMLETLGGHPPVALLAFDVVNGMIVDPNIDKTDGIGLIDPFHEAFGQAFPELLGLMPSFDAQILKQAEILTGKDKPNVFILTSATNKFQAPQEAFAQKHGFTIGTIADFAHAKGVDIVIRTMGASEILTDPTQYHVLLQALQKGMPMINPLIASVASHKGLIPLLVHRNELPSDWFAHVAFVVGEQIVGSPLNKEELFQLLGDRRGEFVVKVAQPGGKVAIGADMTRREWLEWIKELGVSGSFVVEQYLDVPKSRVIVGDRRYISEPIRVKEQQVRPLLKIYYVGGRLIAEMILGPTKNVNGSGYTIPVAFLEGESR